MNSQLRFVMAQLNFLVGDIEGNAEKIIQNAMTAQSELCADLIIFPELALTGYPPEDLLLRADLYERTTAALEYIQHTIKGIDLLIGHPVKTAEGSFNAASWIHNGEMIATHHKQCLPNYSVFDEVRYFKAGHTPTLLNFKNIPIAISICEDLWHPQPMQLAVKNGAKLMISINASPFDWRKHLTREKIIGQRAQEGNIPIIYVNCIGGQDELVFDGGSLVMEANGSICQHAPFYQGLLEPIDLQFNEAEQKVILQKHPPIPPLSIEARIYNALVLGVKDYIEKNHFPGAIIGLSGGIDSALTLAIAVDAIGANRVETVLMPSRYTSKMSLEDAQEQAKHLGVNTCIIPIEPVFATYLDLLANEFTGLPTDTTEENLQARCRGTILMAISNKKGAIVLATGNKSEMSVGYSTLYGDMVGGFCVLKDVPKTWVYRLADYRNSIGKIIPQRVIEKAPSAELAPNQKDQDYLPPYSLLDEILELYVEKDKSVQNIIDAGYDKDIVRKVVQMVDRNEYKRRQAPIGVRITERAFGRDRRYPITSGFSRYLR
jgi:NAD+ synthase (glutamine-hydrolysing)